MTLRVGVVGFGKMGLLHSGIANALEGSELVAVCESDLLLRRIGARLLKTVRFYRDVGEMLGKENLDAIFVTTPIATHFPIIETVVKTGSVHGIFVEKPLAANHHDALAAANLVRGTRIVTAVGYQKRYSPEFAKAKALLDSNAIGPIRSFTAYSFVAGVFAQGKGWRFDPQQGGALLDLGPHLIDLVNWYFGRVSVESARMKSIYSRTVADEVDAVLRCSGVEGEIQVCWSKPGFRLMEIGFEISGEEGSIKVSDDGVSLEVFHSTSNFERGSYRYSKPELYEGVDFLIGDPEYCIEDRLFLESLHDQSVAGVDFATAACVNETIDKIRAAALVN
ncbi:MAG: Gfo/Idh/MocA family oxidoreductase [Nitrososphaerota archaeon]|nr:Gfo/Idh/MocA family oxidoreductase [Nitrososphaerota archaeon]